MTEPTETKHRQRGQRGQRRRHKPVATPQEAVTAPQDASGAADAPATATATDWDRLERLGRAALERQYRCGVR